MMLPVFLIVGALVALIVGAVVGGGLGHVAYLARRRRAARGRWVR